MAQKWKKYSTISRSAVKLNYYTTNACSWITVKCVGVWECVSCACDACMYVYVCVKAPHQPHQQPLQRPAVKVPSNGLSPTQKTFRQWHVELILPGSIRHRSPPALPLRRTPVTETPPATSLRPAQWHQIASTIAYFDHRNLLLTCPLEKTEESLPLQPKQDGSKHTAKGADTLPLSPSPSATTKHHPL